MTQPIPRGATDRACVLFSDLIEGHWEKVDGEFDASLRGQVDLAREWAGVVDSAGSFERIDAPSARQFGGYTLVDVPLAFAAGGQSGKWCSTGPARSLAWHWNFRIPVRVSRSNVGASGSKEHGEPGS